jgi:ATP-binding cassette subfamily F protein uup
MEEDWLRYGVTARRTRNERRLAELHALRQRRKEHQRAAGSVRLEASQADLSGRLVAEAIGITKSYDGRPIVRDFSARIMRGDRVGVIGPNGAGKTTLLNMLIGASPPDSGEVRLGTNLAMLVLDQRRETLDPTQTLASALTSGAGDTVSVGGQNRHVVGYMKDFLFRPEQARTPVGKLSGGERARVILARAFAQPSNLLVLDEPTNDLDIDSLELLEQTLQDYSGTILLVSHDRRFLDNIVTQTLAPEGNGRWREYVGGYSDWLVQRRPEARSDAPKAVKAAAPVPQTRTRLSYQEQRELEALPRDIEALEREQAELTARMSGTAYYRLGAQQMKDDRKRGAELEQLLNEKYARWEALEARKANRA